MAKNETEQLMIFLKETIESMLVINFIPADTSQTIANELCKQLRTEWGGTTIYITKQQDLSPRDKKS